MTEPKKRARRAAPLRDHPNRIRELTRERGWTYDLVAEKIGAHPKTIGALATGHIDLTLSWMRRLALAFGIRPAEIIERPAAETSGLRAIHVEGKLQAGAWADSHTFDPQDRTTIFVPETPELRGLTLYTREIEGESMNRIYQHGSIVVLSRLVQRRGEIIVGKRYHVRRTRGDLIEETIKTLVRDRAEKYWLQPESDSPEFTAFPLEGVPGETVELIGRVRYAITPE